MNRIEDIKKDLLQKEAKKQIEEQTRLNKIENLN